MPNNLIIPLAGYGRKFSKSGYKTLKPFLQFDKRKKMIDLIIDKFSKDTNIFFIVRSDLEKKYLDYLQKFKNSKILFIKPHKNGPLYSLLAVKQKLNNLDDLYVSYCDINWTWKKNYKIRDSSNYVFCYKGYHPFTEDNNNYSFCKADKSKLIKIKEKDSFTKKWQREPLSIGLFYYRSGSELVKSANTIIENKIKINNEYFPSLTFNFLKKKKIKYVKNFTHVGTPEYYEIYKKWRYFFFNKYIFLNNIKKYFFADELIIPAAGLSKRFTDKNIKIPKFMIKLEHNKKTMIEFIKEYLNSKNKITLITLKKIKHLNNKFNILTLNRETKGQADTVNKILPSILPNKSLYINACDTFSLFDIKKFNFQKKNSDIIVFVTNNYETDSKTNEGSWLKIKKNGMVKQVFLKCSKPKNSLRITGNFYFKNKDIFDKCFKKSKGRLINNELYLDVLIYYAIKMNLRVSAVVDDIYINMGTPKLLKQFNYWNNHFNE